MDVALGTLILVLFLGTPVGVARWRRWEGRRMLGRIIAQTGGEIISYCEMRCRRRGQDVWLLRDRKRETTVITMPLPAGYPLSIAIRRRGLNILAHDVPRLELGDVQFDTAFAVEAAPAALVEQLLGVGARSFLLEHRECMITAKDGRFQMSFNHAPAAVAVEAIEVAAGIVAGIRDAFATLAAQAEKIGLADGDSPYRPIAVEAGPDLVQAHAAEVAKLGALQRRAEWVQTGKMLALVVAAAGAIKLIMLWNQR